uniref:Mbt repeat protein n=1 Tax=Heterorhabditis bacteriophora TaxID=37862 RepID=A0A1I7XHH1_HETBA
MTKHVVPVDAFHEHLFREYTKNIQKDLVVEIEMKDNRKVLDAGIKCYWLATVVKIAGYRVLLRWVGASEEGDEKYDFWIGQRVELLDYNNSTRVRPARIKKVAGRRVCVHILKSDCDLEDDDDDRQLGIDAEFWVDQSSFFLFHVGWACLNGYNLAAKKEYRRHAEKIADALKKARYCEAPINNHIIGFKNEDAPYSPIDVRADQLIEWKKVGTISWEKGMKLELMDPLAQQFNELKVATVLEVLKNGYLRVGMDGPDAEADSVALHCTSPFLFPVGYAEKYSISLEGPEGTENFAWEPYLKQCKAKSAPEILFKPLPTKEELDRFKPGAKLEASDMCENYLICPGTIVCSKGRLLQIHFDGWEESYDQLFDINSNDIFPLGWCEMHGYKLEAPKEEEPPKKKKK